MQKAPLSGRLFLFCLARTMYKFIYTISERRQNIVIDILFLFFNSDPCLESQNQLVVSAPYRPHLNYPVLHHLRDQKYRR
jgi:hypothetical protein